MVVRTEDAVPTAWVYVDVAGRDIGSYVAEAQGEWWNASGAPAGLHARVERPVRVHAARHGEHEARGARDAGDHLPAALLQLPERGRDPDRDAFAPFALVGGVWFIWLLGYNWSVAVAIGFIALAGVAAETGVVMLHISGPGVGGAHARGRRRPTLRTSSAIMEGAVERVRPKMMTVTAIMAGLLPILWGTAPERA